MGTAEPAGVTLKVSVVVPVYNPGSYLRRCAESLVGQTMPAQEYEVIFVDDGSTDDSPRYLDELAAAWPQVRVIHQPNSGWPGKPRNVGIDAAAGRYVFFCDADDWLAAEALASLYEFAEANGSDVVLPKMAGLGRAIPHHVFRTTRPSTSLADGPVMDSLTPHKLFRRAFLTDHQIRFPEGARRLEDHYFVVTAYLLARVISIYADRTCYTHIRRADSSNAGYRPIEWAGYFDNLAEAIEIVERHVPPGPARDRILRRWLQVEMVARLSGRRLLNQDPADAHSLFHNAHRIAAAHFGPGVVELLQPVHRPVAQAVIDGDEARIRLQAEAVSTWTVRADVLQLSWTGHTLHLSGTVSQHDDVTATEETEPPETRFARLFGDVDRQTLADGLRSSSLALQLTERTSGEQWPVAARLYRAGLTAGFTADVDVVHAAAGQPLAIGTWALHAQFRALGLTHRARLHLVEERVPRGLVQAAPPLPVTAVARVAEESRAVALDIVEPRRGLLTRFPRSSGKLRRRVRRVLRRVRQRNQTRAR
jgi:glycosyltransferase involved in cell wall biosynthesis